MGKEVHHLSASTFDDRTRWLRYTALWAPKEANQVKATPPPLAAATSPRPTVSTPTPSPAPSSAPTLGTAASSSRTVPGLTPSTTTVRHPTSGHPYYPHLLKVEYTQKDLTEFPPNVLQLKHVETIDLSENKVPSSPSIPPDPLDP